MNALLVQASPYLVGRPFSESPYLVGRYRKSRATKNPVILSISPISPISPIYSLVEIKRERVGFAFTIMTSGRIYARRVFNRANRATRASGRIEVRS